MAQIVVKDSGPGMPSEEAARVFERFYRVDASRARNHGGSGLGLSIVAAIVAAHGGTVSAKSAPGDGMTVTVRLPSYPRRSSWLETVERPGRGLMRCRAGLRGPPFTPRPTGRTIHIDHSGPTCEDGPT